MDAAVELVARASRTRPGWELELELACSMPLDRLRVTALKLGDGAPSILGSRDVALDRGRAVFGCSTPIAPLTEAEQVDEAYWLAFAVLDDTGRVRGMSEPVEVVVSPFAFGL